MCAKCTGTETVIQTLQLLGAPGLVWLTLCHDKQTPYMYRVEQKYTVTVRICKTQFILVLLLFINYCIIFQMND